MTEPAKRGPGRPKGSRNRPKELFEHPRLGVAALREKSELPPPNTSLMGTIQQGRNAPPPPPAEATVSPLRADVGKSDTSPQDAGKIPTPLVGVSGLQIVPEPPRGLRVVLALRVAMSTPGERVEIEWPAGYPLPSTGDLVVYQGITGHLGAIEHRPAEGYLILHLR